MELDSARVMLDEVKERLDAGENISAAELRKIFGECKEALDKVAAEVKKKIKDKKRSKNNGNSLRMMCLKKSFKNNFSFDTMGERKMDSHDRK